MKHLTLLFMPSQMKIKKSSFEDCFFVFDDINTNFGRAVYYSTEKSDT